MPTPRPRPILTLSLPGRGRGAFNYMRNSVKVVVDAMKGLLTLDNDVNDPTQVYSKIFPAFKSMDLLSDDLKSHIRYPSGLFDVQANMYRVYHMTDPWCSTTWNMWEIHASCTGRAAGGKLLLIMKLPPDENSDGTEKKNLFCYCRLIRPSSNMTAWWLIVTGKLRKTGPVSVQS